MAHSMERSSCVMMAKSTSLRKRHQVMLLVWTSAVITTSLSITFESFELSYLTALSKTNANYRRVTAAVANENNHLIIGVSGQAPTSKQYQKVTTAAAAAAAISVHELCDECRQILDRAPAVDLEYVDVAGDHSQHPHMGALDASGSSNYVYDPTTLRRNPPPLEYNETELKEFCTLNDTDYQALSRIHIVSDEQQQQQQTNKRPEPIKLFCGVYSASPFHSVLDVSLRTWAPKCDGFVVFSNQTDLEHSAINLLHQGPEIYRNMWQKVRSIWAYIYDNYYADYDFFHLGGEDMWVLVENLKAFLSSDEIYVAERFQNAGNAPTTPLFLGNRLDFPFRENWKEQQELYNSGGPGYTLNRASLKLLVTAGLNHATWRNHLGAMEDIFIDKLFADVLNVTACPTRDGNNGECCHHHTPGNHCAGTTPRQFQRWTLRLNVATGHEHSSNAAVAFHKVKGPSTKPKGST
jgi:glycoprotein-N-acetylgalactosamine 3-beta-galactosyltransferase